MAASLQLPTDVESLSAEDVLALRARAVPGQGRARVLVPEGGDDPPRHAVRARAEGARLRDRHAPSLPRDVRVLARGRAAVRHDVERFEGPPVRRTELWETKPDLYLAIAKVAPLVDGARRPRRLDHRHPPRPVADARERAEARLGRASTSSGRRTRSPTGRDDDVLGVHPRARAAVQPAARPGLRLDRRHALDAARAQAARAAGSAPTRSSAASTRSVIDVEEVAS